MNKYIRIMAVVITLVVAVVVVGQSTLAAKPEGNDRPGWGWGDDKHNHTGPPGHSVHPNKP